MEEPAQNHSSDYILDWLADTVSSFPSFLDYPYNSSQISCHQWWDESEDICQDPINSCVSSLSSQTAITAAASSSTLPIAELSDHFSLCEASKKRKDPDEPVSKTSQSQQNLRKSQSRRSSHGAESGGAVEEVVALKKSAGNRKSSSKAAGNGSANGSNKDGRWAEHLLNPCAGAIVAGNLSRVQHLMCVLRELASATGDANHRLADHGLHALSRRLFSSSSLVTPVTFSSVDPLFFQRSLIKFHEVSPWFAFPNNVANSTILQILAEEPDRSRSVHILDIGVSHGVQWPTLLEALTRRPGGPPPLVRLTVVSPATETDQNTETPFAVGPPGDNISSRLLSFAKSMNINLQINRLDNHPLQNLNAQVINTSPAEILFVCAQFRLHDLNHSSPDERTEFLRVLRDMEPRGVILSDNNMECGCSNCGDFAVGFSRRVEFLWRFLDSTSSAFKGRESDERRVMEGEAAKALTGRSGMNEGKEKWCERMKGVGFVREMFGEDAIDGARALMRRYDNNWEMRVDANDGCVGLWWKGQPVSFCSLWKVDIKANSS